MAQARQDPRDRKITELQAKLAESEKLRLELLEDGLRLSQENEALRMQLAALKKPRK